MLARWQLGPGLASSIGPAWVDPAYRVPAWTLGLELEIAAVSLRLGVQHRQACRTLKSAVRGPAVRAWQTCPARVPHLAKNRHLATDLAALAARLQSWVCGRMRPSAVPRNQVYERQRVANCLQRWLLRLLRAEYWTWVQPQLAQLVVLGPPAELVRRRIHRATQTRAVGHPLRQLQALALVLVELVFPASLASGRVVPLELVPGLAQARRPGPLAAGCRGLGVAELQELGAIAHLEPLRLQAHWAAHPVFQAHRFEVVCLESSRVDQSLHQVVLVWRLDCCVVPAGRPPPACCRGCWALRQVVWEHRSVGSAKRPNLLQLFHSGPAVSLDAAPRVDQVLGLRHHHLG